MSCKSTDFVCDGIKTGASRKGGYGTVLSAYHPQTKRRILCIINGFDKQNVREKEGKRLLEWAFTNTNSTLLYEKGKKVGSVPVRFGDLDMVAVGPKRNVGYVTSNKEVTVKTDFDLPKFVKAPIRKGTRLGDIILRYNNKEKRVPLVALQDINEAGFFKRLWHRVRYGK